MNDDDEVARRLLRLANNAYEHAFVLLDTDGRINWWSPGAEKLFAIAAADAIGMPFRAIFTEGDQYAGIDQLEIAIARSDAISEDDRWHKRGDGSRFWSTGAIEPIEDDAGTIIGYGKILRDRTTLAEQMALLRARANHANEIANAHAVTIATLSHEIRNAMMAIAAGISQLERPTIRDDKRRRVTQLMKSQIEVLTRLNEDLLAAYRERAAQSIIKRSRIVLQDLLQEIAETAKPRLGNRRCEMLVPKVPIVVNGDLVRLMQAFGNIVDNAIKHTRDDGRLWIKLTIESHEAVVHVEDNGRGIPYDMLSKIFNLFTQVDPSGPTGGLGVGLAVVHEVVMAHGGSVQARSEGVGKGSTFTVRLPLPDRRDIGSPI